MSYRDFIEGRTAQELAREEVLRQAAREEELLRQEQTFSSALRPLTAEEMLPELDERRSWRIVM